MKYEIKNRYTGELQFTGNIEEGVPMSVCAGRAVKAAMLHGVDLQDVILLGAFFNDPILLGDRTAILQTNIWTVYIVNDDVRIGCEFHPLQKWLDFSDEEIYAMHENALEWWEQWKPRIVAAHATANKGKKS